jgi:predicted nucleotide-binding protein
MTVADVENFLKQRGAAFERVRIEWGQSVRVSTGEVVNIYDSGKVVIQGKKTALRQELLALSQTGMMPAVPDSVSTASQPVPGPSTNVFVVYGHDTAARDSLELLLRRMGLTPIILAKLPAAGDTIIEKLEKYLKEVGNVGFACVLLTPDDQGHRATAPEELHYRARQNVILELGMVLARLSRKRVAILYKESVERPSDIDGLLYLPFKEHVEEVGPALFKELADAGYSPDASAL